MLSRRLTLGVGAALLAGCPRPAGCRRRSRHGHARLGLLQPGQPRAEAGGLARGGAEAGRDRGAVGAEPGLEQGAGVPQRRQPRLRLDRRRRGAAGQGQRQPDRDRLDLLQAGMDRPGHPPRRRHRQGRGPEGQADRGHQGHRPLHLPAARAGQARARCRRRRARPAAARPGPRGARARRRRRLGRPRPDDGRRRAVARLPPVLPRPGCQHLRRAQRARGVRGGASRDRGDECWRSTSVAGEWALANPAELAQAAGRCREAARARWRRSSSAAPSSSTRAPATPSARRSSRPARPCRAAASSSPRSTSPPRSMRCSSRASPPRSRPRHEHGAGAAAGAGNGGGRSVADRARRPAAPAPGRCSACCCRWRSPPLWELAARAGWIEARLLPPPSKVAATLGELYRSGELARHLAATLWRVAAGFALGLVACDRCWARSPASPRAPGRLLDPTMQALRAIPSIAWVPLFILWFGIFEASKVALIAVGAFFPIYLSLMTGIQGVDRKLVEVGRVCQLGPLALVARILIPGRPAGLAHRRARRARARLDVRDRGRADGRVRGAGLPAARRPDARQRGADPGCPGPVRDPGQGHRQPARVA